MLYDIPSSIISGAEKKPGTPQSVRFVFVVVERGFRERWTPELSQQRVLCGEWRPVIGLSAISLWPETSSQRSGPINFSIARNLTLPLRIQRQRHCQISQQEIKEHGIWAQREASLAF